MEDIGDFIKKLLANGSLGDYWGIVTYVVAGISSVTVTAFLFWRRYKNRYTEIRKSYLEKINAMSHLFLRVNNILGDSNRNADIISNRNADIADLIQSLNASVLEIQDFHSDHPEALREFDDKYLNLTTSWNRALNQNWQRWCDSNKGNAYINGRRNWDAFSMSRFLNVYYSMNENLNALRDQVRDSIS